VRCKERSLITGSVFSLWVVFGGDTKAIIITGISEYINNIIHIFIDPDKGSDFHSPVVSRPVLGSNKPPFQWEFGAFHQRYSSRGMKLTKPLQLIPKIRKNAAVLRLHNTSYLCDTN
jgi:hypothetical protein